MPPLGLLLGGSTSGSDHVLTVHLDPNIPIGASCSLEQAHPIGPPVAFSLLSHGVPQQATFVAQAVTKVVTILGKGKKIRPRQEGPQGITFIATNTPAP